MPSSVETSPAAVCRPVQVTEQAHSPAPEQEASLQPEPVEPTHVCRKCKWAALVLRAQKTRPSVDTLMRMLIAAQADLRRCRPDVVLALLLLPPDPSYAAQSRPLAAG